MKRVFALLLCTMLVLSLAACGEPVKTPDSPPAQQQETPAATQKSTQPTVPTEAETEPQAASLETAGDLGDYHVEITGFELANDYEGKPAIVVGYTYTNNGAESAVPAWSVHAIAYQNGVQLDTAIIGDDSVLDAADQLKEIQTGASIEIKEAYLLSSDTAPVEFEIAELISFDDTKLGETFEIADGGVTTLSAAPAGDPTKDLGDYTVSVVSYKRSQDYEGTPAIIVTLGFTNNGDKTSSFATSMSCKAFQDGVELDTAIITGEDSGNGESQMRYVKPGAGISVTVAFVLSSETSPVSLEIEEIFNYAGEKIEAAIPLA